jgi:hypothetical protein
MMLEPEIQTLFPDDGFRELGPPTPAGTARAAVTAVWS